jgi:hypothetical protein
VVRAFGTGSDPRDPIGDEGGEAPVPPEALVLELRAEDGAPAGTLRYGDLEQPGVVEGYTWCVGDECTSLIADFAFYPPVSEFLVVPPGTPIVVTGDGVADRLRLLSPDDEVVDRGPVDAVPAADGRYVLAVGASWSDGEQTGDASIFFGVQTLSSPEAAPDVLEVDCGYGATRTDSAVVQTRPDGVHVRFVGTDGFNGFEIVGTASSEESSGMGGSFEDGGGLQRMTVPPGRWEIGCATAQRPVDEDSAVSFEVVDPADHYAPVDPTCDGATTSSFTTAIPSSVPDDEMAARVLVGLAPADRVRGAGYGADTFLTGWMYVVDREGEAIAKLTLSEPDGAWGGTFEACPDSGIELATDVLAPAGAPDVLVLRCEGLGPAVHSDVVRLQADGLHVEATNVEHASAVIGVHSNEAAEAMIVPFEEATERFVWAIPPGPVQIGCRVEGQVTGSEPVDHLVEVEVLPADG